MKGWRGRRSSPAPEHPLAKLIAAWEKVLTWLRNLIG